MSKDQYQYRNHPNSPCAQGFQLNGNKTTKKGWWTKKSAAKAASK